MDMQTRIDRQSSDPAYLQLVNILKAGIGQGMYLPGDRLPSESKLCKEYEVSPMTVRRSINALLDQGIVTTVKGSGTYVKVPNFGGVTFNLDQFHALFRDKERTRVKMLEVVINRADDITAKRLGIRTGERTILIRRLLVRDGDPILYHREHLIYDPRLPSVEAELEVTSLHGLFVGTRKSKFKRGDLMIKAAVLSKEEADLLNTLPMQPAFHLEHVFYDFKNKPVSWGRFTCHGDRLTFTASVGLSELK
jgi:DNA-binding GntR family transcriptional regulator